MNNREIKFRAFDKEGNEFTNEKIGMISMDEWYLRYGYHMPILKNHSKRYEYMQYTGLNDKNGKPIYEGDILNIHIFTQYLGDNLGVCEGEKEFKAEITIQELGLWLQGNNEEECGYILWLNGVHEESFEVIGNIYENKELLSA